LCLILRTAQLGPEIQFCIFSADICTDPIGNAAEAFTSWRRQADRTITLRALPTTTIFHVRAPSSWSVSKAATEIRRVIRGLQLSRFISLKWKAVIGVILVTVSVLTLVGVIQMHYLRQELTRMVSAQYFAAALRMAKDIDTRIETSRDVLVRLANGLPVALLQEPGATRSYFQSRPALLGSFDEVQVFKPNGEVVADLPERADGRATSRPERAALDELEHTLEPVIAEPAFSARLGEPALQILVPILDQGRLGAILIGVLKLQNRSLLGDLATSRIGKSGVFLVLSKGETPRYVSHPDPKMILQPRPVNGTAATARALEGFEGNAVAVNSRGIPTLYSYKSLTQVRWLLLAVAPLQEAFAPLRDSDRLLWLITVLVCLLVVPVVWFFAWWLLSPLSALRDEIEKLRGKNAGGTLKAAGRGDEIGDLARAFDSLLSERATAGAALRQLTEELQRNSEKISYMARHDPLTGLPNRTLWKERMEEALARQRRGVPFAVLCLDLDRFKRVNDGFGHGAGDRLLQRVAERMNACVREVDTVARMGGDEFAIILADAASPERAQQVSTRLIETISERFTIDGNEVGVGVSIGVAMAPGDGDTADVLLARADLALYAAKAAGRGTNCFFASALGPDLKAARQLVREQQLCTPPNVAPAGGSIEGPTTSAVPSGGTPTLR
jgi:diguanylate cyclase (GGDEF)-like protein